MTTNDTSRWTRLDVSEFSIDDGKGATRHYTNDGDLTVKLGRDSGFVTTDTHAYLLVRLGIDGEDTNGVTTQYYTGPFRDGDNGPAWEVLSQAIETLEALRDQIEVMMSVPQYVASEHNAITIGRDSVRSVQ